MANYIINNIAKNWKLDAFQEDVKYFFHYKEVKQIQSGRKCYVIGRKGMGKSAICNYLVGGEKGSDTYFTFSKKLTFKNFPFNELYDLEDKSYPRPNQYITLWKYLIYTSICRMMIDNNAIDGTVREELKKAFPTQSLERLNLEVKRIASPDFKINLGIFEGGAKYIKDDSAIPPSWIEKVEILESFISEKCTCGEYYIVFDELDEDYSNVKQSGDISLRYIPLLTGLLKAVQDIKSIFSSPDYKIKPVVFLRNDIYDLIIDADKNKWSDYKIDIEWDKEHLKQLIAYRIKMDCHEIMNNPTFETIWGKIVKPGEVIHYGSEKQKVTDPFDYICRSTMLRPRDLISYIRGCCEVAIDDNKNLIDERVVIYEDRAFSNYLRQEIRDEIYPVLPDIDAVFNILSTIRKQMIKREDFIKEYHQHYSLGRVNEKDIDVVLETLFNFSIIGNQHRKHPDKFFFKYLQTNMTYNRNETIVIHRGLLKSLQID